MSSSNQKVISLLSGGVDSATATALAKKEGFDVVALSFDYNQRHIIELEYAKKICDFLGIKEHIIFKVDIGQFGGSALTDKKISVPFKKRRREKIKESNFEIPITYVPMRNLVFLSIATSLAEAKNCRIIYFGANIVDYSGYPDCRPQFIESFKETANLASKIFHQTGNGFKIETPLIGLTKAEIVKKGLKIGFDYSLTYSCYEGKPKHCKKCDACNFRFKAFKEAGIKAF
jgi:7-cyano-7-deazaguanine synthase